MKKYVLSFVFIITLIAPSLLSAQGAICAEVEPFCSDFGASFPASTNTQSEPGNQYGCLGTQPNPAWYYLQIDSPGYLEITMTNSNNLDVDFIVYGPYPDIQAAQSNCGSFQTQETSCPFSGTCPNGVPCDFFNGCVNGDGVDCSYDPQSTEIADIPNAQTGEVYVFLITNFSNQPTEIFVNQTGGVGSTDCSIVECRTVSFLQNDSGDLINLPATIDCTDAPLDLVARPGDPNNPGINEFITPAFGIQIGTDAAAPFQNSLEIYDQPDGMGNLLGYWAPGDTGGPYQGQVEGSSDFTAFGEYLDPTGSYSFVWCDLAGTGFFSYEITNYALDEAPNNDLGMGNLNNNNQDCFTVNFGAPTGTATFTGNGITDTGTGRATFDPSALAPGTYTITYSWDDGDNCSGSETQTIEVTCDEDCVRSGGQVVGATNLELCFEDDPYILETINEITDPAAGLPDVLWAVWVLEDPLNVTIAPGGGPIPNDQFQSDDPNYIGVWNNGPGQIVFGNSIELIPDGSGVTYFIAPLIGLGPFGTFDTDCTGLDPSQGYTIYMNPPLSANINVSGCDIEVDLSGGFPEVDDTADYSWSYTTPAGQTVTGTGTPINVVGGTDGNYTFSITDDGNGCDLPDFASVTLVGCNCAADAGTFAVNNTTICYDNFLEMISAGDYAGSFEDGTFGDNAPNGDGDMYNGVGYAMFSQPPSGVYFPNDPNFIGLMPNGTSPNPAGIEQTGTLGVNTIVNGTPVTPGSTFFFTTVYYFDVDDNTTGVGPTINMIDCFDSNPDQAIAVTFLDSISAVVNQTCNAVGGVDITFELSGGHPDFNGSNYTISGDGPGGTVAAGGTYTITDHAPGTPYIVIVGDEGGQGCTRMFEGTSLSVPTVELTSTDADCDGNAVGTATAIPGSGSGSYNFDWSNNGTTSTITGLVPDTYTVTVTDDLGCSVTGEVEVEQPLGDLSVVAVADSVSCNNGDDGSITAMPMGGTEPYTYQWSTSVAGTQTLGGLSSGIYTVTVLDANGCQADASAEVEQPTLLGAFLDNIVNPSCFGESTGSIQGVPTGGTPPFTYTWTNGQMTETISDLPVGFYGLTVTDANGCDAFASTTLSEPSLLTFSTNVDTDASCEGSMDGQISTNTNGGTVPYTYAWSHDMLNAPIASNLNPGNYTVTVTDDNGCFATADAFIASTVVITDAGMAMDANCNGESTGSITANPTGSPNLPYSYTWSANANTGDSQTATGLVADTYAVTITDAAGCSTTAQYVINEPTELLIGATVDNDILCNGDDNGQATVNVSGGTPNYNYQWSVSANNQITATATNLPAGMHSVVVTDANSCEITAEVEIIEPPVLSIPTIGSNEVSCTGGNDGFVTATPQGGTPDAGGNYEYEWSPNAGGQTTATAFNLIIGTYTVTVTDDNGCTVTGEAEVIEPTELLVNTIIDMNVSCNGGNDGQATASASGGSLEEFNPDADYEYEWSASTGNQTTATAINLPVGMHTISVTDFKGCLTTAEVTITEPTPVIVDIIIDNNVNCNGGNDAQATATASGGTPDVLGNYIYQWSANAGGVNSPTAASLPAGTYTITVTDANGCTGTNSVEITAPDALALDVTNDMNVSCFGGNDGAATATPSGGTPDLNGNYTYEWSASAGGFVTPNVTTLPAGTHTVTVTDDNGCTITGSVDITEPNELTVSVDLVNNVSCISGNDGAATANPTGGTPNAAGNYMYQWSASAGNQTGQLANNLPTGTHTVTITDDNNCTVIGNIDITEPTALGLTIDVDKDVNCGGGTDGQATAIPTGGTPDAAGDYTYQWSASANDQTTATAINLPAGTHNITVTDTNACEITGDVTIAEPPVLSVDIILVNNVNCGGGTDGEATAVPTGGTPDIAGNYTYEWSASAGSQMTATASNLNANTHTVTVTDANGCTATSSIEITEPVPVTTGIDITPVSCNGGMDGSATANPMGGTPNADGTYNYQWSANAGGVFTQTASGLAAGVYTVVVTDANGCATPPINITVPEPDTPLTLMSSGQDASCDSGTDGSVTVDPTGGTPSYTYQWSANAASQTTQTALNVAAGTYTVTVTDLNGCTETAEVTIAAPDGLELTLTPTDPACFGELSGSIAATVTGGTEPYTYAWSDGQMTAIADSLPQGNHSVFITDANGCMISDNLTLTAPPEIVLDINTQLTSCVGSCDGIASVLANGGAGGFTYEWDNGETTETATGLCPGPHFVTVTDATGCEVIGELTITGPTPIFPGGSTVPVSCFGGNDGAATMTPTGGTPSYSYEWFANGMSLGTDSGASSSITDLTAGVYTVVVTDANGCATPPINITVVEPLLPLTLDASGEGPSCNGGDDGFVTVEPEGGTASYSYQWSAETGFQDTQTAFNLAPGTYAVTVSDANGCTETGEVSIDEPSAVDFSLSSMPATCFGDANGRITVENATGGMSPYTYSVDNEIFRTDSTIFGLEAGLYTVYVQDAQGCIFTDEVLVEQPFEVIVDAGPDVEILFGDSIQLTAQVNQPPGTDVTFNWESTDGFSCMDCDTIYVSPFEDVTYEVTASIPSSTDNMELCDAFDDIRVNVNKDRNVFIPNVFSPDGDGSNDIFMVFGGQGVVQVLSFRVYDRWGELMFEDGNFTTNDPTHGWDGTFRGKDVNPGVYVFAAEVEFIDGVQIPYAGDVTVVR